MQSKSHKACVGMHDLLFSNRASEQKNHEPREGVGVLGSLSPAPNHRGVAKVPAHQPPTAHYVYASAPVSTRPPELAAASLQRP